MIETIIWIFVLFLWIFICGAVLSKHSYNLGYDHGKTGRRKLLGMMLYKEFKEYFRDKE